MTWITGLKRLKPCSDALKWAMQYSTVEEAWGACNRGDWLLWYAARVNLTPERHKNLVRAACLIAKTRLDKVASGDNRPSHAITVTLAWTDDLATIEEVRAAAEEADKAVKAAWAADKGAWAAEEADMTAWAAIKAAWAARAATWAAEAAESAVRAVRAAESAAKAAWAAEEAVKADKAAWAAWAAGAAGAEDGADMADMAAWAADYKAQAAIVRECLSCPIL